ncbi:MAG: ATP-binding cassette domain-containing protein [Lentisphaeria bacterium]|jgi:ABC-2 type transport system ATP-binding protein|nr:ATP-binding cassette domain-containing protein [Lentisphaeria bacterium]
MSDSEQNVVEAVGLKKVFCDFWRRPKAIAVDDIDFTIRQGEVIGLLGPNGSGKSTTVKMLLGLLRPSGGNLKVFNRDPADVRIKSRIGYLPEETYLYKYLTATETLDFFGALFNMPSKERQRRTTQLLDMVGLNSVGERPVGEFSKGMARRVGLAQALINDPDLVVLDEPTSGLDPIGCNEVKKLIRVLAERGKTVILCSHLLADVEDVCDNIYVMYGGKIRVSGELDNLLTVEDKTRIVAPKLSEEVIGRVMEILNEATPGGGVSVDHPTMNLETFFMDVVRKARDESAATSGATTGEIASYLSGEDKEQRSKQMLENLARVEPEEPAESTPAPPPEPEPDHDKLAGLVKPEPEPESAADEEAAKISQEERDQRNKQLERLLGGDDQ